MFAALLLSTTLAVAPPSAAVARAKLVAEVEAVEADIDAGAFAEAEARMKKKGFRSF